MKRQQQQQGITIPVVLAIMTIVTILAVGFMGVVRFQIKRTGFEQATITAAYVAEMGFQQIRAELAASNGEWELLGSHDGTDLYEGGTAIVSSDCIANPTRCQRIPDTDDQTDFRIVRENPLDTNSRVIGIYEVAIENGQKRALFGNKTITGSTLGFVPSSVDASEQVGYDVNGNELCDQSAPDDTCPGGFLGVKVKAWLTDAGGNVLPNSRSQAVYGVLQLDSRSPNDEGPSGFMLESNADIMVNASTEWDGGGFDYITLGGFYGPMHTNEQFKFQWESLPSDMHTITKSGTNGWDFDQTVPLPSRRPYWGVLMAEKGCQGAFCPAPRMYQPGIDLTYIPFGQWFNVSWSSLAGIEPTSGSNYSVDFLLSDGSTQTVTVNRGAPNGNDFFKAPFTSPFVTGKIAQVYQGGTIYQYLNLPNDDYNWATDNLLVWQILDPNNLSTLSLGANEPNNAQPYRAVYIAHSPIRIYENMTYSGTGPSYEYWHTHVMDSNWPLYQVAHGHSDVVGADLDTNTISNVPGPGYDGTSWRHGHTISTDLTADPLGSTPNTYLKYMNPGYIPALVGRHEPPLLMPTSNINNYRNQLEQFNKYLQLTLGVLLPRNTSDELDATVLASAPYNVTDYAKGYIVNKFPSNVASYSPYVVAKLPASLQGNAPLVDFRAVYFGNELTYSAGASNGSEVIASGSAYTDTAWIWVNDNRASADYMKVSASRLDANYRRYLYRQIPPSKILLVRDAVVLIGNFDPQSGNCGSYSKGSCLDYHDGFPADVPGQATIVDGQLTILSFTTTPPPANQEYLYNRGDIVVVGNVIYHNDFFALPSDKKQLRQLSALPTSPYTRSNTVNGPIANISDSTVEWVTNTDGTRHRDSNGIMVGSLDGLGLFATHDIKISVTAFLDNGANGDQYADNIKIQGQLIAGSQVWVHGDDKSTGIPFSGTEFLPDADYFSNVDRLEIWGTVYSQASPNFSEYFRIRREYFFDRSLQKNPLIGAPYYPQTAGDYRNQAVYSVFPRLIQGSWSQGLN